MDVLSLGQIQPCYSFIEDIFIASVKYAQDSTQELTGHVAQKSNPTLISSISVRLRVHIIIDNIMTRVFKSTVSLSV